MTGIERLRTLAGAWDEWGLGGALAEIADQIERERECERDTIENLRLELGEARDDAAWVRAHGGLDAAEDSIKTNEWALSLALIAHDALFGEDSERDTTPTEFKRELDRRLMPEGMEWLIEAWPKFEDDAPAKLGDMALIDGDADMVEAVQIWIHGKPVICGDNGSQQLEKGERVRRPAPAVLASDGEPLEAGQTVWDVLGNRRFKVLGFASDAKLGEFTVKTVGIDGMSLEGYSKPSDLTHQRPVLDADGAPIKKGDTVWEVGTVLAIPMTVVEVSRDTVRCEYAWTDGKVYRPCYPPSTLTHTKPEPPDSWERIEEDARGLDGGVDRELFTHTHEDIVRRCRALAERERGV